MGAHRRRPSIMAVRRRRICPRPRRGDTDTNSRRYESLLARGRLTNPRALAMVLDAGRAGIQAHLSQKPRGENLFHFQDIFLRLLIHTAADARDNHDRLRLTAISAFDHGLTLCLIA